MRYSGVAPALFSVIAIGGVARAQSLSQNDSLRLRNDCRLAQHVIATGKPAPKTDWAYGLIRSCPEAGGALASAWSRPHVGEELRDREFQSTTVRDARILRAALLVAADAGREMAERRSALEVVTQLCRPGRTLNGVWSDVHNRHAGLGVVYDRDSVRSAQPIQDADREATFAALDRIVTNEPQSDIGIVSRFLARELRRSAQ